MLPKELTMLLKENSYPGRGIVLGLGEGGQRAVMAYFIMGRSENSRNRVLAERNGGVVTEAADPAKMKDPSLIIYAPVRVVDRLTIVTNGDQTDTIADTLAAGGTFEQALRTRTFEPDVPNYTPRISGLMSIDWAGFTYALSILKSAGGDAASAQRFFFEYPQPQAGVGHFIHTYNGDGDPLPSYEGEPVPVAIRGSIDDFGEGMWNSLDAGNKVSLFVRTVTLDGDVETRIYNRFEKKA